MSTDRLRVESNERVDIADFRFISGEMSDAQVRQLMTNFMTDPSKTKVWILDGFEMTNPSLKELTITKGRALLAWREGGTVHYGALTTEGPNTVTIDLNTYAINTYGVYIRFEFVDGETQSRIFWNPAGDGSEYAQSVATRELAQWSVRIETTPPGAEWTKIGEVEVTGSPTLTLTDQRNFYFEGAVADTYESGWSSDGGGGANDRDADRAEYGVKDFQTFTAAMRQCIEDIKGRGLRRWWDRDIGGLNVGFDSDPIEDRIALGNANHFIEYGLTARTWQFATDYKVYWDNVVGEFHIHLDGSNRAKFSTTFLAPEVSSYDLGTLAKPFGSLYLTNGMGIYWGDGDYLIYNDAANAWYFSADSTVISQFQDGDLRLTKGLNVGFASVVTATVDDAIQIGDANFSLAQSATPTMTWDSGDTLKYDRSTNVWQFHVNSVLTAELKADGLFRLEGGTPKIILRETDAALHDKVWGLQADGEDLVLDAKYDTESGIGGEVFRVARTDTIINSITTESQAFNPSATGANLGTATERWDAYLQLVNIYDDITLDAAVQIVGDLIPSGAQDVGSNANPWNYMYVNNNFRQHDGTGWGHRTMTIYNTSFSASNTAFYVDGTDENITRIRVFTHLCGNSAGGPWDLGSTTYRWGSLYLKGADIDINLTANAQWDMWIKNVPTGDLPSWRLSSASDGTTFDFWEYGVTGGGRVMFQLEREYLGVGNEAFDRYAIHTHAKYLWMHDVGAGWVPYLRATEGGAAADEKNVQFEMAPDFTIVFWNDAWNSGNTAFSINRGTGTAVSYYGLYADVWAAPTNTHYLGTSLYYWARVYANTYYGKSTTISTFDDYDDLALVDGYSPSNQYETRRIAGEDREVNLGQAGTLPWPMLDETGEFMDYNSSLAFLLGAIKQLHGKVKEQAQEIAKLQAVATA